MSLRIALAQLDPVVGDVLGNRDRILEAIAVARAGGAEIVVTPELALLGYPPRDLILRDGIVEACAAATEAIAAAATDVTVLVGTPRRAGTGPRGVHNSVAICRGGAVVAWADKQLLPGYDVFDEDRYFDCGSGTAIVDAGDRRLGVLICEDLWSATDVKVRSRYAVDPVVALEGAGCDAVLVLNASPFVLGKIERHFDRAALVARRAAAPLAIVNPCGAQDDLVFDGRSFVMGADGRLRNAAVDWDPGVRIVDAGGPAVEPSVNDPLEEIWNALVRGVRGYVRKTGHTAVRLGLSGGIDSALTAVIATAALGPDAVRGVMMPSRYSSAGSIDDARDLATNLGLAEPRTVSIEAAHAVLADDIAVAHGAAVDGLADENLQARLRGIILMTLSNAQGDLVLSTSNKSELAVGYSTLYGDMCGALAVIGDLEKTRVYALARWINAHAAGLGFAGPPIPESSITKPPSAELRPDQTDQDSLPPYDLLDRMIEARVEHEGDDDAVIAHAGADPVEVRRVLALIDRTEYKRFQSSIILKITPRAFGRGRPMPIANRVRLDG